MDEGGQAVVRHAVGQGTTLNLVVDGLQMDVVVSPSVKVGMGNGGSSTDGNVKMSVMTGGEPIGVRIGTLGVARVRKVAGVQVLGHGRAGQGG